MLVKVHLICKLYGDSTNIPIEWSSKHSLVYLFPLEGENVLTGIEVRCFCAVRFFMVWNDTEQWGKHLMILNSSRDLSQSEFVKDTLRQKPAWSTSALSVAHQNSKSSGSSPKHEIVSALFCDKNWNRYLKNVCNKKKHLYFSAESYILESMGFALDYHVGAQFAERVFHLSTNMTVQRLTRTEKISVDRKKKWLWQTLHKAATNSINKSLLAIWTWAL